MAQKKGADMACEEKDMEQKKNVKEKQNGREQINQPLSATLQGMKEQHTHGNEKKFQKVSDSAYTQLPVLL
jgi:hypothetical protein